MLAAKFLLILIIAWVLSQLFVWVVTYKEVEK